MWIMTRTHVQSHETQQPVIQNQGRTEEVPQGVAAMSSSGQQSGQQEGTEPAKAPRTGQDPARILKAFSIP